MASARKATRHACLPLTLNSSLSARTLGASQVKRLLYIRGAATWRETLEATAVVGARVCTRPLELLTVNRKGTQLQRIYNGLQLNRIPSCTRDRSAAISRQRREITNPMPSCHTPVIAVFWPQFLPGIRAAFFGRYFAIRSVVSAGTSGVLRDKKMRWHNRD